MKACVRILLIKLKECTNTIEMNQLIHEIRTALDNILNMYPSDPDILSKLIIDKLGIKQRKLELYAAKYLNSKSSMDKLPIEGLEICMKIYLHYNFKRNEVDLEKNNGNSTTAAPLLSSSNIAFSNTFIEMQNLHAKVFDKDIHDVNKPVLKSKIKKIEKNMNKIVDCARNILKRDPTNLYILDLLEEYYVYINSICNSNNDILELKLSRLNDIEWINYCIHAIEMGGIVPNEVHFHRFFKYINQIKQNNNIWFENFSKSRVWWKDVYENHPCFDELVKILF